MTNSRHENNSAEAFDFHPWKIHEPEPTADHTITNAHYASLFSLGNGYLGLRASHEDEQTVDPTVGTYLNGFYESADIHYGEIAFGYARESQTMLNIVNPLPLHLVADGKDFSFFRALAAHEISGYQRTLSMSDGLLERQFIWTYAPGRRLLISSRRLVSQIRRSIAVLSYTVYVLDDDARIQIISQLDGTVTNQHSGDDPRIGSGLHGQVLAITESNAQIETGQLTMGQRTCRSDLQLGCAAIHRAILQPLDPARSGIHKDGSLLSDLPAVDTAHEVHVQPERSIPEATRPGLIYNTAVKSGEMLVLEKTIALTDSRSSPADTLVADAVQLAGQAAAMRFDTLYDEQKSYMTRFWQHSQVQLKGDLSLQQGLHFNIFHLLQSAGRDGLTSVSAKGLSGEGYEGHYFWDTELYILPFFLHTLPEISRSFLAYRYQILPQARQRAREMGHPHGALFAWRTINGHECSAYYPAGTAQYHINADIAHAVTRYHESTGDDEFLWSMGVEMLAETAALWLDLGSFSVRYEGQFCIQCVTGPDEYNVLVNNNYYTNLMAQANLRVAADAVTRMAVVKPDQFTRLCEKTEMDLTQEAARWRQAAEQMYLPRDEKTGLCLQDDAFLQRKPWDFEQIPDEQYPLLLHFHPLVIYRHQVCKQADMVLAQFMHGHRFSLAEKRQAYQFYEACTTHDSSLSASIFAIMACELGMTSKAYRYFMETARMDLEDRHGNTADGLHMANMAGTWMVMVHGYAGLRVTGGQLVFKPQISPHWDSYQFRFVHRGCLINLSVDKHSATYQLIEGDQLALKHFDQDLILSTQEPLIQQPLQPVVRPAYEPVKAVIFDVDGVLLSTDEQHYLAWKQLADEEGIDFDRTINGRLRGVSRLASLEILLEKAIRPYSDQEKQTLASRKNEYYKALISQLTPEHVLPGVLRCLKSLKTMGIRLATGSSSKNAPTLLAKTGLASYFEATADGNDIRHSKPDPEVFLVAASRLNLDPGDCLVIEDAVSGIEAAKAGGFRSLAVGDAARQSLRCRPDALAHSLNHFSPDDLLDIRPADPDEQ